MKTKIHPINTILSNRLSVIGSKTPKEEIDRLIRVATREIILYMKTKDNDVIQEAPLKEILPENYEVEEGTCDFSLNPDCCFSRNNQCALADKLIDQFGFPDCSEESIIYKMV
jgi:hypothetical protein